VTHGRAGLSNPRKKKLSEPFIFPITNPNSHCNRGARFSQFSDGETATYYCHLYRLLIAGATVSEWIETGRLFSMSFRPEAFAWRPASQKQSPLRLFSFRARSAADTAMSRFRNNENLYLDLCRTDPVPEWDQWSGPIPEPEFPLGVRFQIGNCGSARIETR